MTRPDGRLLGLIGFLAGISATASQAATPSRTVPSPFVYDFHVDGTLEEAGESAESSSPYWWVNSGGRLVIKNGVGATIQGELPLTDRWQAAYTLANPIDTDGGLHPQNLFRLVTRSQWENFSQSVVFRMLKLNISQSMERNSWSGVLLLARYLDGNNLYYLGVRHDGDAVIKKKRFGKYTTLAQTRIFQADASYDRDTNPNLLPGKRWLGLRSVVRTNPDQSVTLQLWVNRELTQSWQLALEAVDTNAGADGAPILGHGYAGVRTDFADVEFDDYTLERL
jgi:hypothetical protein